MHLDLIEFSQLKEKESTWNETLAIRITFTSHVNKIRSIQTSGEFILFRHVQSDDLVVIRLCA